MEYSHTQRSPMGVVIFGIALLLGVLVWVFRGLPPVAIIYLGVAVVVVFVGLSFSSLSVCDEGQQLSVRFGPLPLFGTSIPYEDITRVEPGRSQLIDGWGLHWVPGKGWIYNIWGFGCVVVYRGEKITRIGSDDVEKLVEFLSEKIRSTAA